MLKKELLIAGKVETMTINQAWKRYEGYVNHQAKKLFFAAGSAELRATHPTVEDLQQQFGVEFVMAFNKYNVDSKRDFSGWLKMKLGMAAMGTKRQAMKPKAQMLNENNYNDIDTQWDLKDNKSNVDIKTDFDANKIFPIATNPTLLVSRYNEAMLIIQVVMTMIVAFTIKAVYELEDAKSVTKVSTLFGDHKKLFWLTKDTIKEQYQKDKQQDLVCA